MFKTKKEIDIHVQDIFAKLTSDKEKNLRCFAIAKAYYGIREYHAAKRYLQSYLNTTTNPTERNDALKFMGDILSDSGEKEKGLEFYKQSYEGSKNRIVLNRICDLLHAGFGENDTGETKKKWFELQKSNAAPANGGTWGNSSSTTATATPARSNSSLLYGSPLAVSSPAAAGSGPPKTNTSKISFSLLNGGGSGNENGYSHGQGQGQKTNAQAQAGMGDGRRFQTFTSPEGRLDMQMRYMERHYDDVLSKLLEQNCKISNQLSALTDEFKDYREATERNFLEMQKREESRDALDGSTQNQSVLDQRTSTPNTSAAHAHAQVPVSAPAAYCYPGSPYAPGTYAHAPPPHPMYMPMTDPMAYFTNPYLASLAAMYSNAAGGHGQSPFQFQPPNFPPSPLAAGPATSTATVIHEQQQGGNNNNNSSVLASLLTGAGGKSPQQLEKTNPVAAAAVVETKSPATAPAQAPLSTLFKKAEGSWDCESCYVNNGSTVAKCLACGTMKPGAAAKSEIEPTKPTAAATTSAPAFSFGFNLGSGITTPAPSAAAPAQTTLASKPGIFAPTSISTPPSSTTNIFSTPPTPGSIFGAGPSIFGTPPPAIAKPAAAEQKNTNTSTPSFDFGELAKQSANSSGFGSMFPNFAGFKTSETSSASPGGVNTHSPSAMGAGTSSAAARVERRVSESEDDFVPTAEFTPVIPLPPLVETKKGDEDENLIHEVRTKLYRFESTTKEWKERGTGNIKILQAKDDPAKVRVVMWREQVQKVACNHRIRPGMQISAHMNSVKALTWGANDFSEGKEVPEVFVAKFSNEKQCGEFKTHFQEMIDLVESAVSAGTAAMSPPQQPQQQTGGNNNNSNAGATAAPVLPSLSSLFKKAEGSWDCEGCYVNNASTVFKCAACGTMKPGAVAEPVKPEATATPAFSFGFNLGTSTASSSMANSLLASKPGIFAPTSISTTAPPSNTTNIFGTPPATSSLFGAGSSIFGTPPKPAEQKNTNIFGELPKPTTNFGSIFPSFSGFQAPETSPGNPAPAAVARAAERRTSEGEDDFVPTVEFTPVIPLPPLVEAKKGDENENLIHEVRSKLYRFESATKEWKERGTGNIKILQAKDDPAKVRVVMWREQVQKVACNHRILPGMKISAHMNSVKALTWGANDFSEGKEAPEVFVARFSNEKQCEEFKTQFEKMIEFVSGNSGGTAELEKTEERSASADAGAEAESCPGCKGCDSDNFDFSALDSRVLPTYPQQTMTPEELVAHAKNSAALAGVTICSPTAHSPAQAQVKTPNQIFGGTTTPTAMTTPKAPMKETPVNDVNAQGQAQPSIPRSRREQENKNSGGAGASPFPRINLFPASPENGETTAAAAATAKPKPPNPFATLDLSVGSNSNTSSASAQAQPEKNFWESSSIQSAIGFGDLAQQSALNSNAFGFGGFKGFEGAGASVFGGGGGAKAATPNPSTSNAEAAENTDDHAEEFVPTAEFTPVIPLPPLVEVRKGDEDENLIHEVRAKLYRFEPTTKEWKERGTGNIKILQAKDDPAKVRVVMWREQVQKVACNHRIRPGMKISAHMNSTKAVTWGANDFSEGKEVPEVFVAKFPNDKQCAEFKTHFQEMIDLVESAVSAGTATMSQSQSPQQQQQAQQQPVAPISLFKKAEEGSWDCEACYVNNGSTAVKCVACGTVKPGAAEIKSTTTANSTPPFSFAFKLPEGQSSIFGNTNSNAGGLFNSPIKTGEVQDGNSVYSTPSSTFDANSSSSPRGNNGLKGGKDKAAAAAAHAQDDPEEDGDSETEDDDDEDDEPPMFEGECHAFLCSGDDTAFLDLGPGNGRITYDGDMFCARFSFTTNEGDTLVEHYILSETSLENTASLTYEWEALNETDEHQLIKCRLRVKFIGAEAEEDYAKFADRMADSIEMAAGGGITEQYLLDDEH